MNTEIENSEWKTEAPYLASLPRVNPFLIPDGYFDTLPESIADSVYLDELKHITPSAGFDVPEQYFSSLKSNILAQTSQLPSSAGFSTPDQYFQKLQAKIIAQTVDAAPVVIKETKVVRLWRSNMFRYVSAACFAIVAAFGLYLNQQQTYLPEQRIAEMENEQLLYDINEQDIIEHVQENFVNVNNNNVSQDELENYILNNYSQNDLSSTL